MSTESVHCIGLMSMETDKENAYRKILQSLQQLDQVCEDIFCRVEGRVDTIRTRVSGLQTRVQNARKIVDQVSTRSKKCTTVIASSKYPEYGKEVYPSIVHGLISHLKLNENNDEEVYSLQPISRDHSVLTSFLEEQDRGTRRLPVGLGSLPRNLQSVDSALIFNTVTNPYSSYSVEYSDRVSPNDAIALGEHGEEAYETKKLPDAPTSLTDGDLLPDIGHYDVSFKPQLKGITRFELPLHLDLPDIADIEFKSSHNSDSSIAPSVIRANASPVTTPRAEEIAAEPVRDAPPKPATNTSKTPPPRPPMTRPKPSSPPQPTQHETQPVQSSEAQAEEGSAAPPSLAKTMPPVAKSSSRMDLLSAIRDKDRMVKLKNTAEAKRREQVSQEQTACSETPGKALSVAEEMRLKLQRRQKVLSGALDREEQKQSRLNVRAVQAVGKFKLSHARANNTGPFSLERMAGLDALLQEKNSSGESSDNSEWD